MSMLLAITGNIGSGKSTVSQVFHCMKIPVYNADEMAKSFYTDAAIVNRISQALAYNFTEPSGKPDLKKLAACVFSYPDKLAILNSIIHPLVIDDIKKWSSAQVSPYCMVESAIIFEFGFDRLFDLIILVSAPFGMRLQRIMERDGVDEESVRLRMNQQWEESRKAALADYQIVNDGEKPLIPQVLKLHQILLKRAEDILK